MNTQVLIDEATKISGLLVLYKFSETDTGTMTASSLAGSKTNTVTIPAGAEIKPDGVHFSEGVGPATLNGSFGSGNKYFLYLIDAAPQTSHLYNTSGSFTHQHQLIDGSPSLFIQSGYDIKNYRYNHPGTIASGQLTAVGMIMGDGSPVTSGVDLFTGQSETVARETAENPGTGFGHTNAKLFDGFVGRVEALLVYSATPSENQLLSLMEVLSYAGDISFLTNLPTDRLQTVIPQKPEGTLLADRYTVDEGGQTLSGFLPVPAGEEVRYLAFDTNEEQTIYTAGPTAETQGSLEFTPLFSAPAQETNQVSKVSGIVQINGTPAKRTVRAFGYSPTIHDLDGETINLSKSLGQATSDPQTGEYTIHPLGGYSNEIFVVAFDDYGADFRPGRAVTVGDRIHPATPNGYVWECTGSGTLPSEEPAWVIDTETAQLYGTASMIAKPFYRPMVHGPVAPEALGPTGYQHLRILFDKNMADPDFAGNMAEVELYDEAGNKLAIASIDGNNDAGINYPPSKAIDGNPLTFWLARSTPDYPPPYYLHFQFADPVEVATYKLMPSIYSTSTRSPGSWRIEKSDDGVNWTEISAQTGVTGWKREVFKEFEI